MASVVREQAAGLVAITAHLFDQRIEAFELRFGTKEMMEQDFDLLPIEIALEVEEVGLEQFLGQIEGGADAVGEFVGDVRRGLDA